MLRIRQINGLKLSIAVSISPLYSNIYLNLLDQVWHKRGYPEKLGASLHRFADDAILVCRRVLRRLFRRSRPSRYEWA